MAEAWVCGRLDLVNGQWVLNLPSVRIYSAPASGLAHMGAQTWCVFRGPFNAPTFHGACRKAEDALSDTLEILRAKGAR